MKPVTPDEIRRRALTRKSVRLGLMLWALVPLATVFVVGGLILGRFNVGRSGLLILLVVTTLALISTIGLLVVQLSSRSARRLPRIPRAVASKLARGQRSRRGSILPSALVWAGALASIATTMAAIGAVASVGPSALPLFGAAMALVVVPVGIAFLLAIAASGVVAPVRKGEYERAQALLDRHRWWMAGSLATLHQGTLHTLLGAFEPAEALFRGWLGRWRRGLFLPFVLENLAWVLIRTRRWSDAEEVVEALIDLDPTRGATFAQLGVLDLERGTVDERTVEWLELALELNLRGPLQERPRTEEIRAALAWGSAVAGRDAEARQHLAEVDLEAGAPLALASRCLRVGRAWQALGDWEQGDAMLERAITLAGEADLSRRARELLS
jgi:hypothetical protein